MQEKCSFMYSILSSEIQITLFDILSLLGSLYCEYEYESMYEFVICNSHPSDFFVFLSQCASAVAKQKFLCIHF